MLLLRLKFVQRVFDVDIVRETRSNAVQRVLVSCGCQDRVRHNALAVGVRLHATGPSVYAAYLLGSGYICDATATVRRSCPGADLECGVGGQIRGSGDGSHPVGSRGEAPAGVWGLSPPEAGAF